MPAYFNQTARDVACIAEVLRIADRAAESLDRVSFHIDLMTDSSMPVILLAAAFAAQTHRMQLPYC